MFTIVAVPFESFQSLPPFEFKLMAAVLRYVNRQGECCPALHQLAADVLASEATVSRAMARLEGRGCFTRERQGNGRYLYRIAERFLARRRPEKPVGSRAPKPAVSAFTTSVVKVRNLPTAHLAAVQDSLSQCARQEVIPSSDLRSSEGEQQPSQQDEIPDGWEEAAAAERRLAGLGPVNLACEWRKLVAYSEGQRVSIWRWRGWALKARGGGPGDPGKSTEGSDMSGPSGDEPIIIGNIPGDDRQQRQARDWAARGFWLRDGSWGPAPDQPGCSLPVALVAWCLAERAAAA